MVCVGSLHMNEHSEPIFDDVMGRMTVLQQPARGVRPVTPINQTTAVRILWYTGVHSTLHLMCWRHARTLILYLTVTFTPCLFLLHLPYHFYCRYNAIQNGRHIMHEWVHLRFVEDIFHHGLLSTNLRV